MEDGLIAATHMPQVSEREEAPQERLYRQIRHNIITGVYPQGSRLSEMWLAGELNVSRIPLREVLPRIAAQGLIINKPRRSAVVARWTTSAVHDLFDARLAIEVAGAGYAARRASEGHSITALQEKLQDSEERTREGDHLGFAESNAAFHQALIAASGNPILRTLMGTLTSRMAWLFLLTTSRDHHSACREHRSVVDAVSSGNQRLAESVTYGHIEAGRNPTIQVMQKLLDRD